MAIKVSDVIALLHPKATKASDAQVIAFLNGEVLRDLLPGITSTWRDEFIGYTSVITDGSVALDYSLPTDFARQTGVLDQNKDSVTIVKMYDGELGEKETLYFTFDSAGLPIIRLNSSSSRIKKAIVSYEKKIVKLIATDSDLSFPTHISEEILPILAKGVSYYYLRSRKKTTEVQFIFTEYEDLKSNLFDFSII
jgi:hypothetical protein